MRATTIMTRFGDESDEAGRVWDLCFISINFGGCKAAQRTSASWDWAVDTIGMIDCIIGGCTEGEHMGTQRYVMLPAHSGVAY